MNNFDENDKRIPDKFRVLLDTLNPEERTALLKKLSAYLDTKDQTLSVQAQFDITRARIAQIEQEALAKFRKDKD